MKTGFACVLSGIAGAISGGVGVYFYMRNVYEKKLDERIAAYKESTKAKEEDKKAAKEEKKPEDKLPDYIVHTSIDDGPVKTEKRDYHKMAANYKKKESDISTAHPVEEEGDEEEDEAISFISVEQYEDDEQYDKSEFEWYVGDNIIIDDFGEEVEDWGILFGDLLTDELRQDIIDASPGVDNCYIRNRNVKSDYSLSIIYDDYKAFTGSVK